MAAAVSSIRRQIFARYARHAQFGELLVMLVLASHLSAQAPPTTEYQ